MVNNRNFILPPLIPKTKLMKMIKKERQFSSLVEHIKKYEKNKNVKVNSLNTVLLVESLVNNNNKTLTEKKSALTKNLNIMFSPSTSRPTKKRRTT
jgi:hypothetical protein